MKSIVKETEKSEYPKLMISKTNGQIVLFEEREKGTVVYAGTSNNDLGWTSDVWIMDCFEDFYGEVTLSND